ncbi:hypothetical protein GCM10010279_02990 [Streptomyces mutabilis]|nr:hypothetical protein GCM10010279_02990 [Streptomyces mutabilis]
MAGSIPTARVPMGPSRWRSARGPQRYRQSRSAATPTHDPQASASPSQNIINHTDKGFGLPI